MVEVLVDPDVCWVEMCKKIGGLLTLSSVCYLLQTGSERVALRLQHYAKVADQRAEDRFAK